MWGEPSATADPTDVLFAPDMQCVLMWDLFEEIVLQSE